MFYEGAEKKVEVVVLRGSQSLRSLGLEYWTGIVEKCHATILSHISSDDVDAYLLSESSLFVWDDRFLIITCGQTVLVNSLLQFVSDYGFDAINSIIYKRDNEFRAHEQKTTFNQDIQMLKEFLPKNLFEIIQYESPMVMISSKSGQSLGQGGEFQISPITGINADLLLDENTSAKHIRELLNIDKYFAGFKIDDHAFDPVGYSLNAIKDDLYVTIHITPQQEASYVSFKTNVTDYEMVDKYQKFLKDILKPQMHANKRK